MRLPSMIGLAGRAGAGKSESARILARAFGYQAVHIGRPLKAMLTALLVEFGYSAELAARYVDGDRKRDLIPELMLTATQAQQTLGTEWGRGCCYEGLWLDAWLRQVAGVPLALNESVRFANEAEAIRARGGIVVEIRRPGLVFTSSHVSEAMPFTADFVIWNDGPLEILEARLVGLVERQAKLAASPLLEA
jgi:hypothetical protein